VLGYRISRLAETASTNTVALAAGAEGEPEGYVVVADHQTAGRGRLGRTWVAAPGSALLVSILLRPDPASAHLAVSAVACAAAAACERVADVSPDLKWPNDLLAADRKLAGVLAETAGNVACVVVGLGLNVHVPPDRPASLAELAVDLDELAGRRVPRAQVLDALLTELALRYDHLDRVLDEYRRRCATIGRGVRVVQAGGELVGRATAVADDGSLVVITVGGDRVTVAAGDVIHLRPDGPGG
jgi:BirA family transcriptional regulator, biotin operon repressor / biotin---[acetyl-CoA-carboxylase] ligase